MTYSSVLRISSSLYCTTQ